MKLNSYNRDQSEAIQMAREYSRRLSREQGGHLKRRIRSYLRFRADVEKFQKKYFSQICSQKCFTSQTSACCGREGIATFFADVVINVLLSADGEIDVLLHALSRDNSGFNCVYLTEKGCLWRLKPIVCEMFLCKHAKDSVLGSDQGLNTHWEKLLRREKRYTWPNRPILFDELEALFIRAGFDSSLMYFHSSPGLLRLKARFLKNAF